MEQKTFHIVDYVVMVTFLSVSLGVGIYHGVFKKQKTTEEYLLGNRRLLMLPVAMSLVVSFQSAVSLMGAPAEMYVYDTMIVWQWASVLLSFVLQAYFLVPLIYPLKLVSAYEYLYQRFHSRAAQLLGATIGMIQTLLYMAIVLYAPSVALEAVAELPFWLSVLLMGLVGTIYTSLGGMKSVVWTDTFQFLVLYGGLVVIIVMGSIKIGGFVDMFTIAHAGRRINFSNIDFDPRVRHTVWSCFIGGLFIFLPLAFSQTTIQRIASMRSEKSAKRAMLVNVLLMSIYIILILLSGLITYAYFQFQQCDVLAAGYISSSNQVMPYFIIHVLTEAPGIAGIYIAGLFSASLSTFSSGINGMAAITLHDILVDCLKDKQQLYLTVFAKLIVFVFGGVAIGIAFAIREMPGPVTQVFYTTSGGTGGPLVGMMLLGAMFPQSNWLGAVIGGIIGMAFNLWIGIGAILYGDKPKSTSVPIPISGCGAFGSSLELGNSTISNTTTSASFLTSTINSTTLVNDFSKTTDSNHLDIYDMSYAYLGLVGFLVTTVVGLGISYCTGTDKREPTQSQYVFPIIRRLCHNRFPVNDKVDCPNKAESKEEIKGSKEDSNAGVVLKSIKYLDDDKAFN